MLNNLITQQNRVVGVFGQLVEENSSGKGIHSTAVDLLVEAPENLVIVTDAIVQRVLLEGKKAVGVETKEKECESKHYHLVYANRL